MPEACYEAIIQFETRTWKRSRWPGQKVRHSTNVEIPKGIPYSGKGENAWDCGEDGLFGCGCDGRSIPDAIAITVKHVAKSRQENGDSWCYKVPA